MAKPPEGGGDRSSTWAEAQAGEKPGRRRTLFARPARQTGSFAMVQPHRARVRGRKDRIDLPEATEHSRLSAWQNVAYTMHHAIGELGYIDELTANTVAKGILRPMIKDPESGAVDLDESVPALRVMAAFTGPRGGTALLVRRAALHLLVGGESLLLGTPTADPETSEDLGIWWEFLSPLELLIDTRGKVARKADGLHERPVKGDVYIARLWNSDAEYCVDDETEAFTGTGWKRHDDLAAGDEILTLNHDTGLAEWQTIDAVNRFQVDKELVELRNVGHSSLTTQAHRWPVRDLRSEVARWRTTDELRTTDKLVLAAPLIDLPTEAKWSDDMVELLAWYWTEGTLRPGGGIVIEQSALVNPTYVDRIRRCLVRIFGPASPTLRAGAGRREPHPCEGPDCRRDAQNRGLCHAHDEQRRRGRELTPVRGRVEPVRAQQPVALWRENHRANGMVAFALNRVAAAALAAVIPGKQKVPPVEFLRSLTAAQLDMFIGASVDADGHRRDGGLVEFRQAVRERAEAFGAACVLAGHAIRIRRRESHGLAAWEVVTGPRIDRPAHVQDLRRAQRHYEGIVWCPTTPNGTWLARRDGVSYFTGNSDQPDSPVRRVLSICAEIVVLTQVVDAIAKSRLAAGLLFIPQEMSFGADDETEEDIDELSDQLMEHMKAPVEDRASAAGLVPLIIRGPAALADAIKLIDLARDLDIWAQNLRHEALDRLAQGLNIPPEMVKGKSSLSGLGGGNVAASIDAEFITKHCIPPGELIADFVTHAYYRPMLEEYEALEPEQSALRFLAYDPSALLARDSSQAAKTMHEANVLSDLALLLASGFDEADMPEPEELQRRTAMALILAAPATFGPVLIKMIPGFEDVVVPILPAPALAAPPAVGPAGDAAPAAPAAPPRATSVAPGQLLVMVTTAADSALERALERASAMLVSKSKSRGADQTVRDRLAGDKVHALSLLGPSDLERLGVSPELLLAGAWDPLVYKTRAWLRVWLEAQGCVEAAEIAHAVGTRLAQAMDDFARVNLHRRLRPGDNGLRIPDVLVAEAIAPALEAEFAPA